MDFSLSFKLRKVLREPFKLTLKLKLILSLSAIAIMLLVSSIISIMEYRSMSSYVSGLIADNIHSINMAQGLYESSNSYNLEILAVIGDDKLTSLPDFNQQEFLSSCDSLKMALASLKMIPLADSVLYAYSAYMVTSLELPDVLKSDFIDSRTWYFERLQPRFNTLNAAIDKMSYVIYNDLKVNSATFDRGFYRSIIPGVVAVGVGLLLILMLLFFILTYYVNPICKMLDSLNNYRSYSKKYNCMFEGDDQLSELNSGITELAMENLQLHKRIIKLKSNRTQTEGENS